MLKKSLKREGREFNSVPKSSSKQFTHSNYVFGICLGHSSSSKAVVPASAIKTIVGLSCLHRSLGGYDHTASFVLSYWCHQKFQNNIFIVFNSLAAVFAGVSLQS